MSNLLRLLRVKNYIKNLLIFLPFIFAGLIETFDSNYVTMLIGFIAFCFASSFIYIINDYVDIEKDRLHPKKCNRPLASGAIKPSTAIVIVIILTLAMLGIMFYLRNLSALIWIGIYIVLNILYSLWLKKIPVVDITVLSLFFVIRIYYGAALINVPVSIYLFMTVFFVALMMGANKRKKEKTTSESCRDTLSLYSDDFLSKLSWISMGLGIAFYAIWIISGTNTLINHAVMVISIVFVFFILVDYQYTLEKTDDGNPVDLLLSNKSLLLSSIAYVILMIVGFLLK